MKTVDIITCDLHQLHGANKVTEKLIMGKDYFLNNGLRLRYVVSQDGIVECSNYISKLGNHLDTSEYKRKRKVIELLKKLPLYKSYVVQRQIIRKENRKNEIVCQYLSQIQEKPDFIIYQDPYTAIYYLNKTHDKTKSIFISHADTDPLEHLLLGRPSLKGSLVEKELRNNFKKLFESVDTVVTICTTSQKYMWDVYNKKCPCIINGIEDIQINDPFKYSLQDGKLHLVIVASIQYRKGQDIVVEAFSKLSHQMQEKIKIHIIGDGEGSKHLAEQVKKLDVEDGIVLHGPILDVENYLPLMDAFLLPSRADTVPIAIIEAMRAGLPIFASDVGEIPQMIDGCGELIKPTVESVLQLLVRLIDGNIDLRLLGQKSREKFLKEFQLESMINKYSMIINNVLNE